MPAPCPSGAVGEADEGDAEVGEKEKGPDA